jgi:hypothetical protein
VLLRLNAAYRYSHITAAQARQPGTEDRVSSLQVTKPSPGRHVSADPVGDGLQQAAAASEPLRPSRVVILSVGIEARHDLRVLLSANRLDRCLGRQSPRRTGCVRAGASLAARRCNAAELRFGRSARRCSQKCGSRRADRSLERHQRLVRRRPGCVHAALVEVHDLRHHRRILLLAPDEVHVRAHGGEAVRLFTL